MEDEMNDQHIINAIFARKSIRNFLDKPVSKETIVSILESACRAPSAMNTQPWEFVVLTGEPLEQIKKENVERLRAKEPPSSEHSVVGWPHDSEYRYPLHGEWGGYYLLQSQIIRQKI